MPSPQKRHRRHRRFAVLQFRHLQFRHLIKDSSSRSKHGFPGGQSLRTRYRAEDSSSCSSENSGDDDGGGPLLRRYQSSLLDERLDQLDLPTSADGVEPDSAYRRDVDLLPYGEILEALTYPPFLDGDRMLRDAMVEYQVHEYVRDHTLMRIDDQTNMCEIAPIDSRVFHSDDDAAVYTVLDDIPYEEFEKDMKKLCSRIAPPIDDYEKLDPEEIKEQELKRALYRIKALLLLKGKAIDKLDDAALERKYPRELIVENDYFLDYQHHGAFGWYFDSNLCTIAARSDYQRLVILNSWETEYQDWSRYRSQYNTPEMDRDYLLYWNIIREKIKWVEDYMYVDTTSREWSNIRRIATYQALRIATRFENIDKDLALLGIQELLWRTRLYVSFHKDLDGIFYEIWRRVIKEENVDCFTKALKEVYDLKMFPSLERFMEDEDTMEEEFHLCTAGITKEVPESVAREHCVSGDLPESVARGLIALQVRQKLAMLRGYEHYARKKLKVAEYIGLIGKALTTEFSWSLCPL